MAGKHWVLFWNNNPYGVDLVEVMPCCPNKIDPNIDVLLSDHLYHCANQMVNIH